MTARISPVITARMGPACAKPEPRGERSIHLPAQVSVLALLQQGWMWGINSLTPPQKPSTPALGSLRRGPQYLSAQTSSNPHQCSVSLRTIAAAH